MNCHVPTPTTPSALAGKARTELDRRLAERLVTFRRAKGLTQSDLARAVGVSFQQIQKYERGDNRITAVRLQEVARLLEIPLAAFHEDTECAPGVDVDFGFLSIPGAVQLLRAYAEIPSPELRRPVLVLARELATRAPAAEA